MESVAERTEPLNPEQVITTVGVVRSVQGTNPGPASGISYTVDVNIPGIGRRQFVGVTPNFGERLPDTIDIRAHPAGKSCTVHILPQNVMQFDLREIPDFAECP